MISDFCIRLLKLNEYRYDNYAETEAGSSMIVGQCKITALIVDAIQFLPDSQRCMWPVIVMVEDDAVSYFRTIFY